MRLILVLAGFLAPVVGGRLLMDNHPTAPGWIPGLQAIVQGAAAPSLSLLLIAILLAIASFGWHTTRLPRGTGILLGGIGASMVVALAFSQYKFDSVTAMLPWFVAGIALVLASADDRSDLVLGLFLGCLLVAVLGLHEYMLKVKTDPSWRIFSLWANPNSLASMLGLGVWISADVYQRAGQKIRPFVLLGSIAILAAFLLTQSKGAFLMMGLSVLAYIFAGLASRQAGKVQVVSAIVVTALCVVLVFGLPKVLGAKANTGAAFARISEGSGESVQSFEYRKQLALSTIDLAANRMAGRGMGTYRHVGASNGTVQPALQAHNSWLQLAVEGGLAAPILLAAVALLILGSAVRHSSDPTAQLFAGAVFVMLHGLIDSNLFFSGLLVAFAIVLGAISSRTSLKNYPGSALPAVVAVVTAVALAYVGLSELMQSRVRGMMMVRMHPDEDCVLLRRLWPWDAEGWALSADASHDPKEQRAFAERAYALGPNSSNASLLAYVGRVTKDSALETRGCLAGLESDPNDPDVLLELMELKSNSDTDTRRWANRLIELENSTYLTVPPLPDLVAIQPAVAHLKLAQLDPKDAKVHLMAAMARANDYAKRTVPRVVAAYDADDFSGYAGEDGRRAATALEVGLIAAKRAAATGDKALVKRANEVTRAMREAEAKLHKVVKFDPLKV